MRAALLAALLLALAAAAELVGTPSMDIAYWATLSQVSAASPSGTWWSIPAQYPLIASDPLGRCVAVADRPYLLAASINSTAGAVSVKYAYASIVALYASNGYLLYAKAFNDTAVTAIATDCEAAAVGAMDGRVYVLPANGTYALGSPITALAVLNGTVYAGTEDGGLYEISPAGPQLLAAHPGYVFKIAATARGIYAFWLSEGPEVYVYPLGATITPGAVKAFSTEGAVAAAAVSQDGSTIAVGVYDQLYVYRDGELWYAASLASAPLSIALSANGSIAVVGTRDGHVLVFWNGEEAAQWDVGAPVTSLAVSYTGTAIAYEAAASSIGWVDLAPLRITLRGPPQCSEVPITISAGGANYTYAAANGSTLLAPAGPVTIYPGPVAYGDYRCAPLQPNYTAVVPGTAVLEYGIQYRISKSELVSGPSWAYGPTTFYAPPVLPAQAIGTSLVNATYALAEWLVNNTPMPPSRPLRWTCMGRPQYKRYTRRRPPSPIPTGARRRAGAGLHLALGAGGGAYARLGRL
ncbi:MAG: hypothetical protein TU35_009520 [Thermoproteus sp. AZ2]|uniref:Uncharacterized protein n=1 Tax=Thermoproteus sp. AZ2 TaxID=1609232 RepID=A0ACC6V3X2_9CREN